MAILFLDGPTKFEIRRKIVYIYGTTLEGEQAIMALRIEDLPASMASARVALDKWYSGSAEVVPFVARRSD